MSATDTIVGDRSNRDNALKSLYDDIHTKHMFPFWATSTDVAHDEIKQLMGTHEGRALPVVLRSRISNQFSIAPPNWSLWTIPSAARSSWSIPACAEARDRQHDVHGLSPQRRQ